MQVSVKWLGVIVSAALLTIVTFAGLSQLTKITSSLPASNSDIPADISKTDSLVLDQGEDLIPNIDLTFLNNPKPPKPNYKGKPPTPHTSEFDKMTLWSDMPKVNIPKPSFDISRNIAQLIITEPSSCGDAMPLSVRITPVFPTNATKSGRCNVRFQLDAKGNYINVKAVSCSEEMFAQPSIKAVQRWRMNICASEQEIDTELVRETRITFRLTDENGNTIPE